MINGAVEILGGVPGRHLHPLHLAASQACETAAFIVASYAHEPGLHGAASRFYDLFFLRGAAITEAARIHRHIRFILPTDEAVRTFEERRGEASTALSLYAAEERPLEILRATCAREPCLKLQMRGLSEEQLAAQVVMSRCRNGIIECSEFGSRPAIYLREFRSEREFIRVVPPFRTGTLLLYDLEEDEAVARRRLPAPQPDDPRAPKPEARRADDAAAETRGAEDRLRRRTRRPPEPTEIVRLFERLFRAFRRALYDCAGSSAEAVLRRAEERVRAAAPEFDAASLTDETAVLVLDLLEHLVREAPLLKRSKLRASAALLVADLYAKQLELLERHRLTDAVERLYCALKR